MGSYKTKAQALKLTGNGDRDREPNEVESHNPVQYMQFYIGPDGPTLETSAEGRNAWSVFLFLSLPLRLKIFIRSQRQL